MRSDEDSPDRNGVVPFNPKFLMPDYLEESIQESNEINQPLRLEMKKSIDGLWLNKPKNTDGISPEIDLKPRTSTEGFELSKHNTKRISSLRNVINFQFPKS